MKRPVEKMLLKLSVIFMVFWISACPVDGQDWDLAVATDGEIQLLLSNGSVVGVPNGGFNKLKALTFDNVRHQFIVSDMDMDNNDTIYTLDLTKETDNTPIIADLPDDVQGLAVDPIDDVLYWTDSINHTINYISLKEENQRKKILFIFEDETPQDIAVHVCNRYIYWTNSNRKRPTIERARIGTQQREIIVESDLGMPAGITIDYVTRRIYWADIRGGIFYRLESTNLLGQERRIEFEGIHTEPFAVAVKNEYLYFTDLRRNSLWKYDLAKNSPPSEIHSFEEKPMGLIAKKESIKTLPDCKILEQAYQNYTKPVVEKFQKLEVNNSSNKLECVNGTLQDGVCRCAKGFTGKFCEISLCHNYCFSGTCHLTNQGYPYCHCPKGSGGTRCEKDCDGYCLNGGDCRFSFPNARLPICVCPEGFRGLRCEGSVVTDKLCDVYCSQESKLEQDNDPEHTYCKCSRRSYVNVMDNHSPQALLSTANSSNFVNYFQDPVFITMICITFTVLAMCLFLTIYILHLRRKPMPRIKRRYIVNNKNSTSMTERPQHPEQCEITIENCCNMNVCETPCFEPSKLQSYHQSRSDDKKMLLPNMERTEDMY